MTKKRQTTKSTGTFPRMHWEFETKDALIEIPTSQHDPRENLPLHLDIRLRRSPLSKVFVAELWKGCMASRALLADGRPVASKPDAVIWLLEQCGQSIGTDCSMVYNAPPQNPQINDLNDKNDYGPV